MTESEFKQGVSAEIARLARDLHSHQSGEFSVDDLLLEVTDGAVRMLPEVHHAGITLIEGRNRNVRSLAATGPIPSRIDWLQERHSQGPCLDAIWEHHTVRVGDYTSEKRWPKFAADLLDSTPVKSSLSIQLYTHESELGALNLYSEESDSITSTVEELALALAAHAAVGLANARRNDQFQSALASRDVIGQAKGIIMERFDVDARAAFGLLTRLSQEKNMRLVEIARRLAEKDYQP